MLRTFYDRLCKAEAVIAAAFLILMVSLIFVGGVVRMMGMPLVWTTDFATCFFAWACFLCADVAWRNDNLISIRLVADRLPMQMQTVVTWINYILIVAFLIYLIWTGLRLSYVSSARSFQGIPWMSYSWVTMSLPVGAALLLITTVLRIRNELFGGRFSAPASAAERGYD
jgi:TRAP-type C4-dicarboxylate transport system permease small subunit